MKPDPFGLPQHAPGSPSFQNTLPAGAAAALRIAPATARLRIVRRHAWRIIAAIVLALGLTYGASSLVTPMYEATATIDIDMRMPAGVLRSDERQSSGFDTDQFMATQIKLIQSDSVLRPVAQRYRLQELENQSRETSKLPESVRKLAPVTLWKLRVNRPPNTFLIQISYRSPDTELSAKVANDIAAAYVQHTYDLRYRSAEGLSAFMEKQLEQLKAKMERSSDRLLAFDRELNVADPAQKTAILSSRLVQINSEYATAEGDRVRKEAALNSIKNGSIDAAQVSTQGDALRATVERLNEAQRRFAQVKSQFGKNFPEYKKAVAEVAELQAQVDSTRASVAQRVEAEFHEAANREAMLAASVAALKREFDALNARSFGYQTLKRDAEADRTLYDELVQKIKEAGINAGFQNSSIRIADAARPTLKPVSPNIPLNLFLALCFSTFGAVVLAMLLDERDLPVRDAEQLGSALQISVLGSLPLVKNAPRALIAPGASKMLTKKPVPLTRIMFEEAVQSLCSTVLLSSSEQVTRSVVVSSPLPGQGKTLTACHLAAANARKQRRTLLIDCDLRSPAVHLFCGSIGMGAWTKSFAERPSGARCYAGRQRCLDWISCRRDAQLTRDRTWWDGSCPESWPKPERNTIWW